MGMGNSNKGMAKAIDRQTEALERAKAQELEFKREQEQRKRDEFNQSMANLQIQQEKNDQQKSDNIAMYKPGVDMYYDILGDLKDAQGADSWLNKPYTETDFMNSFEYNFLQEQGNKTLDNSASARGSVLSGAEQKRAMEFNQGLASQQYQAAFARDQQLRQNRLQGMGVALNEGHFNLDGTRLSRTPDTYGYDQNNLINNNSMQLDKINNDSLANQTNYDLQIANLLGQKDIMNSNKKGFFDILTGMGMGALGGFASGGGLYGSLGGAAAGGVSAASGNKGQSYGTGMGMGMGINKMLSKA